MERSCIDEHKIKCNYYISNVTCVVEVRCGAGARACELKARQVVASILTRENEIFNNFIFFALVTARRHGIQFQAMPPKFGGK